MRGLQAASKCCGALEAGVGESGARGGGLVLHPPRTRPAGGAAGGSAGEGARALLEEQQRRLLRSAERASARDRAISWESHSHLSG